MIEEKYNNDGTIKFRIEDANLPYIIANMYDVSTKELRLLTHTSDRNQAIKRLESKLASKGLDQTYKIKWFKDVDGKNYPVLGLWTNNNFDIFGFVKLTTKDEETGEYLTEVKHFCFKNKPLF